jgi:hypothetical protein
MASQRAKYRFLLEDPDVQRWYRNLARGSQIAADICLRRLGGFCAERRGNLWSSSITCHYLLGQPLLLSRVVRRII